MILDLVLWSGVFGSGYAVFKRQDKLFERRVLKEQKRRTSVLKARLLGEQAQREQDHSDAKAGSDMKEGILIKDGRSLELLGKVDTIVFDKTGTLTEETPGIGTIHVLAQGSSADDILALAAAAEHRQTNPLARAILGAGAARGLTVRVPEQSEYRLGYGVRARLGGETVTIGSARFMGAEGIALPEGLHPVLEQCKELELGHGVLLVARGGALAGAIELQPALRPEASATIAALRALPGIREIRILSGDRERPPRALAEKLGMDAHDAQVSVSLQGASQLANDTAQIVLMNKGIRHMPRLFDLSAGFKRHMNEQFMLILTPLALGRGADLAFRLGYGLYHVYEHGGAGGPVSAMPCWSARPPQGPCRSRLARPRRSRMHAPQARHRRSLRPRKDTPMRRFLRSKIHRAIVTQADLHYEGSLSIDRDILEMADIAEHEEIQVWNVTRGTRFATYAMEAPAGSRMFCVNGAAAHLVELDDLIIIASFTLSENVPQRKPTVVLMDAQNEPRLVAAEIPGPNVRKDQSAEQDM